MTVIGAGVGWFFSPHDRAVLYVREVETKHDPAVIRWWHQIYIRSRFGAFLDKSSNPTISVNYSLRFYIFTPQMADNIRRALQNINLGIEDVLFTLPQAIVQQAVDENRFCLMGRPLMP